MSKDKNIGGRPPFYNNVVELQDAIDDYFKNGIKVKTVVVGSGKNTSTVEIEVPTITGLALHLGFGGRSGFYDLLKKKEYEEVLENARKIINPTCNKAKHKYSTSKNFNQSQRIIERRKLSPSYRLRMNIASLLRHHLKGNKTKSTLKTLGYTIAELKAHLEKGFYANMTWDNYGKYWHVDHIHPASLFDHSDEKQVKECWALENLQALTVEDNLKKGDRILIS